MKTSLDPESISNAALSVTAGLRRAGFDGLLVGGCVRDLLLGGIPKDFDVITNATPEQVVRLFRHSRIIGRRFRLVLVREKGEAVEVSTYRGESGDHPARRKDQSGRIVDDNLFGTREQDVMHRDFTVNALYCDPDSGKVIDYMGGAEDIGRRTLRCIGDPELRYREDPVRMLRAVRFSASLDFKLDAATEAPLQSMAPLLEAVPAARRFGEVVKLLHNGNGMHTLKLLRHYQLAQTLLPLTTRCLDADPAGIAAGIVPTALANTDARIRDGRPVVAPFLYAVLLWEPYLRQYQRESRPSRSVEVAATIAGNKVLEQQNRSTSCSHRFSARVRQIWDMQRVLAQYAQRSKDAQRIMSNPCFRAAYDFLLLRATHDESLREQATWWTEVQGDRADGRHHERGRMRQECCDNRRRRRGPRTRSWRTPQSTA